MSFDIKVTGLDEAVKMIEDTIKDIQPKGFAEWADKIEKSAKEICDDPDCKRITFKVKKGTTNISISFNDKEALECIRKSIKKHLNSMSSTLKIVYSETVPKVLKDMEKQLEDEIKLGNDS